MSQEETEFDTTIHSETDISNRFNEIADEFDNLEERSRWKKKGNTYILMTRTRKLELEFNKHYLIGLRHFILYKSTYIKNFEVFFYPSDEGSSEATLNEYNHEGVVSQVNKWIYRQKFQSLGGGSFYSKIIVSGEGSLRYAFKDRELSNLSINLKKRKDETVKLRSNNDLDWKEQKQMSPLVLYGGIALVAILVLGAGGYFFIENNKDNTEPSVNEQAFAAKKIETAATQKPISTASIGSSPRKKNIEAQLVDRLNDELYDLKRQFKSQQEQIVKLKAENEMLQRLQLRWMSLNKKMRTTTRSEDEYQPDLSAEELKVPVTPGSFTSYKKISDAPKGANLYYNKRSGDFIDLNSVPATYRSRFMSNKDVYEKVDPSKIK